MRSIILLCIVGLVYGPVFSQSAPEAVLIRGELSNAAGIKHIYLDRVQGAAQPIDTVSLDANGSFEFRLYTTTADVYRIRISEPNSMMVILQPGDTLDLKANALFIRQGATMDGSLETMKVYSVGPIVTYFEQRLDSLTKVYQDLRTAGKEHSEGKEVQDTYTRVRDSLWTFLRVNISNDPGSLAWLFFLEKLDIEQDLEYYNMVTDALSARFPDNFYVKNLVRKMEAERRLGIGGLAPDIRLPSPEGDTLALSALRGKVVLIDFWAGWCSPCRKENPNLRRIYRKYKPYGFEIFGVSLDKTRESWLGAVASDSISWPQVSDLKYWQSEAASTYQVTSIPHTVLLDREGRIIARKLRGEALEQKLEEIFRKED